MKLFRNRADEIERELEESSNRALEEQRMWEERSSKMTLEEKVEALCVIVAHDKAQSILRDCYLGLK
jgi:hypothetical protein